MHGGRPDLVSNPRPIEIMNAYNREETVCQSLGLSHEKILVRDPSSTISLVRDEAGNPATLKVIAATDEEARGALKREIHWLRHPPL